MTRRGFLSLLAGLAATSALAAPQLKPPANKAPTLVGTTWTGNSFEMKTMVITFEPDGSLKVIYNGAPIEQSTWEQDGTKIHLEINKSYLKFDGKLVGERIEGECYNVACQRWQVTMARESPGR